MAKPRHYSPVISRFIVSVLYHEAKHRKVPMTQLTDELLFDALRDSQGWQTAISLKAIEVPQPTKLSKAA